jgi:hypothetical protein
MTGRAKVLMFFILMAITGTGYHFYGDQIMTMTKQAPTETRISARNIAEVNSLVAEVNQSIYNIKSKNDIVGVLNDIETKVKANPNNLTLRLYRAVLNPLRSLEGISWRFGDVLETSRVLHMSLLQAIREVYYNKYQVGNHIKALVQYLTVPVPEKSTRFSNIGNIQDFLNGVIWTHLDESVSDIQFVLDNANDDLVIDIDGKLAVGEQNGLNLISEERRYVKVVKGNIKLMLAGYLKAQAFIKLGINYNFNAGPEILKKLVKETGLNTIRDWRGVVPEPVTPKQVAGALDGKLAKDFLSLRTGGEAANNLKQSFQLVCKALKIERAGHAESIDAEVLKGLEVRDGIHYAVNPFLLAPGREDMEQRFGELFTLFAAGQAAPNDCNSYDPAKSIPANITSVYTGESIDINVGVVFKPHADLKSFLSVNKYGTRRADKVEYFSESKAGDKLNGNKWYTWDYDYGMPTNWPDTSFAGLIPTDSSVNRGRTFLQNIAVLKRTNALSELAALIPVP